MNTGADRSSERAGYSARQANLLDTLMRGDDYPAGFDVADAEAAGRALRRKRARAIRHAWPGLATALGGDFETRIDAFLRAHPSTGDGLVDGLAFTSAIAPDPALADDVRVEIVLARAQIARLFVGACRLADPKRLVVVIRTPRTRPRVYCLPLGPS